ncbi:MAG: tetratricopeptide repeat protein [Chitinophagales bacterium]
MINNNFKYTILGFLMTVLCLNFMSCNRKDSNASVKKAPQQIPQSDIAEGEALSGKSTGLEENLKIRLLSNRLIADSLNSDLYFTRGNAYLEEGRPEFAVADFIKAIKLDSTQSSYYLAAAEIYFKSQQLPPAIRIMERAIRNIPQESQQLHLELGKYYFYVGKNKESSKELNKVLAKDANVAEAYFWKGMIARDKEDVKDAITNIKKSLQLESGAYNPNMILGQILASQGNAECLKYYDQAAKIDPLSIESLYAKALFLQENKREDEALKEYTRIISISPQYQDAHYNTGYIYFKKGEYERAKKSFHGAVRVSPAFAKAYYMRGYCDEKLGDKEAAKGDYERAVNFDPELSLAQEGLDRVK